MKLQNKNRNKTQDHLTKLMQVSYDESHVSENAIVVSKTMIGKYWLSYLEFVTEFFLKYITILSRASQ